jgi:TonB-linked SusC/RagA family outer membrane protein
MKHYNIKYQSQLNIKTMKADTNIGIAGRWMVLMAIILFSGSFFQVFGHKSQEKPLLSEYLQKEKNLYEIEVSIELQQASIAEAFELLEQQMGQRFLYNKEVIEKSPHLLDLNFQQASVADVLMAVTEQTGLRFRQINRLISVGVSELKEPEIEEEIEQQATVTGQVVDAQTGEALPGVNILIQGTSTGTSTDVDGSFQLNVSDLEQTLIITYIGYDRLEISIDGRSELNIELQPSIIAGDELVVVGYGTQQRSDLTGSIASIDRRDVTDVPVYSMENVLQGRAAGVEVRADGFRPGEGSTIRIRGTRSFVASNDPLIVLDGIPIDGGLMDLNPSDVESIEILKDASATAIYGSRGANGVILITTRRGQDGINVEYSGYAGLQYTFNRIDVMDTPTLAEFERDNARLHGYYTGDDADIFESWQLEAIAANRTTDWQDLAFERGFQQSHNISLRGASGGTTYAISGTFDDHRAVVINNDFTRYSARLNLDQRIGNRLMVGLSSGVTNSVQHQSVSFARVVSNSPMSNPFDTDGNPLMYNEQGDRNPLFDLQRENSLDRRSRTRVLSTIYADLELIPEKLNFRANVAPDLTFREDGFYTRDLISEAGTRNDRETSVLFEGILNYSDEFLGLHRINVTSLYSIQNYQATSTRLEVSGLPYERQLFHNLGSADNIDLRSSSLSEWKLESYMLRFNYVFDNRYMLTVTGRLDGSSRLAAGNEYGLFPSMALAWQIGNESFMSNVDLFSELKLRFSFGEVGNTAINPYQTQGALQPRVVSFGDGDYFAFEHGSIPNPDLRWERTQTMDLGLDFALFEDRIRGSIDVYQSITKDLLLERQLPITSGYSSILENVGETRNQGIEFGFYSVNVNRGNFLWSTDLNVASNRNEIIELFGGREDDPGSGWFIGHPVNAHYDFKMIGIWQSDEADLAGEYGAIPGDLKFLDVNGDGTISGEDRVILGNPDPKWSGGITNRLSYKSFDFSAFIYAAQGMTSLSGIGSAGSSGLLSFRNERSNLLNVEYWMPDRPSNKYPRPRTEAQVYQNALAYMNTSFVRLRNVTLGYTLPPDLLSRFGARNMRVYVSGQNLYTWTPFKGYDPEGATGLNMPNYQTFLLGIDLSF